MTLESIRKEYTIGKLTEVNAGTNPFELFDKWLNEAVESGVEEPTAMVVSTISSGGYPQSRIVLLKSANSDGFIFYTNYLSEKGIALGKNNKVSLLFFWAGLQRQVRVAGDAFKVARHITEAYFMSRPRGSQLAAWASEQSRIISSRKLLDDRFKEIEEKFKGRTIPPPPHWGGYIVKPLQFEFWQGRESRLHDRLVFSGTADNWQVERLSP
jgi:pyridoxamine 5'-phosphate oxidase